jgi:hypothetical protein
MSPICRARAKPEPGPLTAAYPTRLAYAGETMADDSAQGAHDGRAYTRRQAREAWLVRRRNKIKEEIERNRRGEYRVPTWVLAAILVAIVAGWAALIFLS